MLSIKLLHYFQFRDYYYSFYIVYFWFSKKNFLNNTDKFLIEKVDSSEPLFSLNEKAIQVNFIAKDQ